MAILPMLKVNIYALSKNRKKILEFLQHQGLVSICEYDDTDNLLGNEDTSAQIIQFDRQLSQIKNALEILDQYSKSQSSMFSEVDKVSVEDFDAMAIKSAMVMEKVYDILSLSREIAEQNAIISKYELELAALDAWSALDVPMRFSGTKTTTAFIGTIPREISADELTLIMSEQVEVVPEIEVLSSMREQSCVVIIAHNKYADKVESVLRSLGYSKPNMNRAKVTPVEQIKRRIGEIEAANDTRSSCSKKIVALAADRQNIGLLYDFVCARKEKYKAIDKLKMSEKTFVFSAFVAKEDYEKVETDLQEFDAYVEITQLSEGESAPVKLKNNSFAKPVENMVESYSMPSSTDIDPVGVMAFFYYLFFGMMFSDAGYGLIMVIACSIFGFIKKDVKQSIKNSARMFFYCGVSTLFWGVMFGSFFGNAITVVSGTFFGMGLEVKPVMLDPVTQAVTLLVVSLGFGAFHIFVGYLLKFIALAKRGKVFDAICDAGFWMIEILGACLTVVSMFVLNNAVITNAGIVMALAGVVGNIVTGGRNSSNLFGKIFGGLGSVYDIIGLVGDILSYSRIMALGLATGVIATAMNTIGTLAGNSAGGVVLFIIVFIVGHAMNFGINALGAYVHTMRLQYVEFFSKFYEGGGDSFKAFSLNTKYVKIKEEK